LHPVVSGVVSEDSAVSSVDVLAAVTAGSVSTPGSGVISGGSVCVVAGEVRSRVSSDPPGGDHWVVGTAVVPEPALVVSHLGGAVTNGVAGGSVAGIVAGTVILSQSAAEIKTVEHAIKKLNTVINTILFIFCPL
jgi:hypothetical protein